MKKVLQLPPPPAIFFLPGIAASLSGEESFPRIRDAVGKVTDRFLGKDGEKEFKVCNSWTVT